MHTPGDYLAKYRTLVPPEASVRRALIATIRDECGIDLTEREVVIKNSGAMIASHPTVRSEVVRMAPRILTVLREHHAMRLSFIR